MESMGIGELYNNIPPAQKKRMVRVRFRNFRVEVEEGSQVNKKDLRSFRGSTSYLMKKSSIPIKDDNQKISLHDYFTAGFTFMTFFKDIDESSFEGAVRVKEAAEEFMNNMNKDGNPFEIHFAKFIHVILFYASRPDRVIYAIRMGTIRLYSGGKHIGVSACLYFRSQKPVKRKVILEKKKRIAYRVGVPDRSGENIEWVTLPRNFLLSDYSVKHKPLDMYIQSHALRRFDERTRGLDSEEGLRYHLNTSLSDLAVAEYKNGSGLLEFIHKEKKLGYFVFTLLDDILLLRTFLFLTNSGTPEGKKIDRLLRIRKADKQYLEMDTAYAFMNTDLLSSPWLCDLLVEAGCEQLCDIVTEDIEDNRKTGYALDAARYLGLPETIYSELV